MEVKLQILNFHQRKDKLVNVSLKHAKTGDAAKLGPNNRSTEV